MEIRAHIVASGLVQGIGYRYFISSRAVRFGLLGYVKNIYSGEVEIEIEGDRSLIEEFIIEVKVGPRAAQIKNLKIEWLPCTQAYKSFEIL
jgi:acylphosphatase